MERTDARATNSGEDEDFGHEVLDLKVQEHEALDHETLDHKTLDHKTLDH